MPTPPIVWCLAALNWYFKKNVFEESKMVEDFEANLTEMDKDGDMKNGVRVQIKQFNFELV
jgi:hypothetical protein